MRYEDVCSRARAVRNLRGADVICVGLTSLAGAGDIWVGAGVIGLGQALFARGWRADDLVDEWFGNGSRVAQVKGGGDDAGRLVQLLWSVGEEGDEGITCFDGIAKPGVELDAGVRADGLSGEFAASAEALHGPADGGAVHAGEEAGVWCENGAGVGGLMVREGLVEDRSVAALGADEAKPGLPGAAAVEEILREGVAPCWCVRQTGQVEHVAGEGERELDKVAAVRVRCGAGELEDVDALSNLKPVPRETAERLVHRGEEGDGAGAGRLTCLNHEVGEEAGLRVAGHEGAGADLHVEHKGVEGLGEFLAHDAGGDEERGSRRCRCGRAWRRAMRSAGTRSDVWPMMRGAGVAQDFGKLAERELGVEAGDGFELVERAAGVAERATADHRHADSGVSCEGEARRGRRRRGWGR